MPTLHLGVLDINYEYDASMSTYDVATILEEKYGIMQKFYEMHETEIATKMAENVARSLTNAIVKGDFAAPRADASTIFGTDEAMDWMKNRFSEFISSQEVERSGIAGVPTMAALKGVNHRLKRPYVKDNPRRPSFRDTGTYESSFKSWVTDK